MSEPSAAIAVVPLTEDDWPQVEGIYRTGNATGHATFETEPPDWDTFNARQVPEQRLVATDVTNRVLGWVAAHAVSERRVYAGVVEHSVYVDPAAQGRGIGRLLLDELVASTEKESIWTIQPVIFRENTASLRLHKSAEFPAVGTRDRIGTMTHGAWEPDPVLRTRVVW